LRQALVEGDGAFKLSYDKNISDYPIIEFMSGTRVNYEYKRGRLDAVCFITKMANKAGERKQFVLQERYSKDGVSYTLYKDTGVEIPLDTLPELADLKPVQNPNKFLMAVQLMFDKSAKYEGRGKSLFDNKSGSFDAFDEVCSQWVESLRDGRTNKYIPQTLVPKNPETGAILKPNSFDNRYIMSGADLSEDAKNIVNVVHGDIPTEGLLGAYTTMLDLCLQGLISPSTLGIDMKKLDNAEAQREKEKTTLYTRNKIVDKLEKVLPKLIETVLKVDDMLHERVPGEYEVSVSFGEYANPSFEAQVETLGKAKTAGIMSTERVVEELYGDSLTDEEKEEEVERLKSEQGVATMPQGDMSNELEGSNDDIINQQSHVPDGSGDGQSNTENNP
jgi:hypothetical protein